MPTSVIVTMGDEVVPLRRQIKLFEGIPTAQALRVDAGHDAVVARPTGSSRCSLRAVDDVVTRRPVRR